MSVHYATMLLKNGWTLNKFLSKWGIDHRRGKEYPQLVTLHCTDRSPMRSHLVQECVGLTLDESNGWITVARPFDKFFHSGSAEAATLDWKTVRVEELLDGKLCSLYYYNGKWRVASAYSPDAVEPAGGLSRDSLNTLFWKTWAAEKFDYPPVSLAHLTWLFCLTSPFTSKVVRHKEHHLTCLGLRHLKGVELKGDFQDLYPHTVEYELDSMDEVYRSFEQMDPTKQAGYVLTDLYFKRNIIRHPAFDVFRKPIPPWSLRKLADIVRHSEEPVGKFFPECRRAVVGLTDKVRLLAYEIEAIYWLHKDEPSRKEFALRVKDLPYSGVLFALRDGEIQTAEAGLRIMPIDRLLSLVTPDEEDLVIDDGDPSVNDALGG